MELDIASVTWVEVMIMVEDGKVLVCLSIFLFVDLVLCLTVFTNCLLKALAFCCGAMAGLLLKEMVILVGAEGFLPLSC